ncbi:hypothetical protein Bca4012_020412 [Brassica carinata]
MFVSLRNWWDLSAGVRPLKLSSFQATNVDKRRAKKFGGFELMISNGQFPL